MVDLANDPDFTVSMRRFGKRELSGEDLREIRSSLLGITQAQLGKTWNVSRNEISRVEQLDSPDVKTCDAYRGLVLLYFLER